jgi:type IV pilus assembly protein PilP
MISISRVKKGFILSLLCALMLCACSSAGDELTTYIHRIKNRPPKPIEPIPEFKPLAKFEYPEHDSRRSPFKPIVRNNAVDLNSPDINRPKQPLEAFPLDALTFVGILKQNQTTWALIAQPGGLVTRVKVGDFLGKNFGQILRIKNNDLEIEETVQVDGRWDKRKITINLHSID